MKDLSEEIRSLKTEAKNCRDQERYEAGVQVLTDELAIPSIPFIRKELSSASLSDENKKKLASELADCLGLLGGIFRRWALEPDTATGERAFRLQNSVDAYEEGYKVERQPEFNIISSYNMLNRLVSYILLRPDSMLGSLTDQATGHGIYDVKQELEKAKSIILEQLAKKKKAGEKDVWGEADLALVTLLLDSHNDPVSIYADFNALSPSEDVYESALSTLRPLAKLDMPAAQKLKTAVKLLETKLGQLYDEEH